MASRPCSSICWARRSVCTKSETAAFMSVNFPEGFLGALTAPRARRDLANLLFDHSEETLGALVLGTVQHVFRGALFDDLTVVDEDHTIGDLARKPHLMGHHDHGH